ncbi:MAG: TetR family transcriptional regulator [Blastocatellia bacterium]|nr:TetR family transcriptional regulator [Blastocatellia bacterium]
MTLYRLVSIVFLYRSDGTVSWDKQMKDRNTTRETILRAAVRVIEETGISSLTLELVASHAGVSKGGLLYHFPSKEALITGLLQLYIDEFEIKFEDEYLQDPYPEKPGRWLRAYIRASAAEFTVTEVAGASLIAAVATNPDLLKLIRTQAEKWKKKVTADIDPVLATVIRLAVDGLCFADIFEIEKPQGKFREEVLQKMVALTMEQKE